MSVHHLTIVAVLAGLAVNPSVLAQHPAPATRVADAARTLASDAEILAIIKQRVDEKRSAKEVDAQLSFVRDAQGAVTAAVLHQNGQDSTAPRVRPGG